ncbi:hypothetical protein Tco_0618575 [Tanacetum coccineum]
MSRMEDDLFTYEVEISEITNIPCDLKKEDDLEQQISHESDNDTKYDPSNVEFTEWLASKNFNHKTMDHYTMKALWIYWARGDDEVELTDEESSNSNNEDEVAKIFRIETNVFDFETPLCRAFKEFNYILQIDPDDGKLKEEALKNKAITDGMIDEDDESSNEGWKRWDDFEIINRDNEESENEMEHEEEERSEVFDDHERSVCNIRRFEMIKYSFRDDEEYMAIKENEYDDLTNTSKEAIQAYQEIFRMMDERWMVSENQLLFVSLLIFLGKHDCVEGIPSVRKVWDDWEVDRYGNANLVIMEYLAKISKKARILELKRRHLKITVLTSKYVVSIKEDTAYLCLHFTKDHKGNKINTPYPGKTNTPYSSYGNNIFWKISNVVPTPRNPPICRIDLSQYVVSTIFQTL